MAHGGGGGGGEGVEVNLIPMIDIVIQLITFFLMLVNFDNANIDERIRLPIADLAKPSDMEIDEPLVLNVNRDGLVNVSIGGDALLDVESADFRRHMEHEAAETLKSMKRAGKKPKMIGGQPQLWTTILIRADLEVPYGKIQRMIRTCQDVGYHKFALRATPPARM